MNIQFQYTGHETYCYIVTQWGQLRERSTNILKLITYQENLIFVTLKHLDH